MGVTRVTGGLATVKEDDDVDRSLCLNEDDAEASSVLLRDVETFASGAEGARSEASMIAGALSVSECVKLGLRCRAIVGTSAVM